MKKILLSLILWYRRCISPLKKKAVCRFYPTCSEYAYEAIEKYGAIRGGAKALWRIMRCNPFSRGGYDPLK
ncbi:MAG: membrane protein insertion efficiency factor YidD [Ruminococcaceae bacterium]|nr:membrane protein insertion efficiency factor YidD [Oscillospiraceae bacterium]